MKKLDSRSMPTSYSPGFMVVQFLINSLENAVEN